MIVAAIDAGTNTVLMLIARIDDGLTVLKDEHSIVRLGESLELTGLINDAAYDRLSKTIRRYRSIIDSYQCTIAAKGTSALRSARNANEIIQRIKSEFDIALEPISGSEEARLTYIGAAYDLPPDSNTAVIDIGGGSTEIGFGLGSKYLKGFSIDIGAVRLKERGNIDAAAGAVKDALRSVRLPDTIDTLIAVAGTPTSLAAIALGLNTFEKDRIDGTVLTLDRIQELSQELSGLSAGQLQRRYPVIPEGRADILPFGTLILLEAMKVLAVDSVTVSTRGLRFGIAIDAATKR